MNCRHWPAASRADSMASASRLAIAAFTDLEGFIKAEKECPTVDIRQHPLGVPFAALRRHLETGGDLAVDTNDLLRDRANSGSLASSSGGRRGSHGPTGSHDAGKPVSGGKRGPKRTMPRLDDLQAELAAVQDQLSVLEQENLQLRKRKELLETIIRCKAGADRSAPGNAWTILGQRGVGCDRDMVRMEPRVPWQGSLWAQLHVSLPRHQDGSSMPYIRRLLNASAALPARHHKTPDSVCLLSFWMLGRGVGPVSWTAQRVIVGEGPGVPTGVLGGCPNSPRRSPSTLGTSWMLGPLWPLELLLPCNL